MKQERPYQIECHEAVISKYNKEVIRQLIVAFTGSGKTFMLIRLLEKLGFKRVLWLSFQEELVYQSALAFCKEKYNEETYKYIEAVGFKEFVKMDNYSNYSGYFQMGLIKADTFYPNGNVIMGSVMTVKNRLDQLPPDYFDCIVCDEAHLYASVSAINVLNHFKPKLLLGATATPHRADGVPLGNIFDEITFEYGLDKGIKDGYAAELYAIRIKTNVDLDAKKADGTAKVRTTAGEFNQKDLSNEVNTLYRNQLIVNKWKQYAIGRQTIAFCVDISHAIDLAEAFKENGINAVAVSSDEERTPNREKHIKMFKEGKIDVITNVAILVAGFDHVNTGCAIMACPTKSLTKYLQSVGRIARLKTKEFVDKFGQKALILDVVDNTNKHNLINAWELDKEKDIEDRTFVSREKKDLLLAARKNTKLEHTRVADEIVKLLKIPKIKINLDSPNMKKPITEPQRDWLIKLGHKPDEIHFTHGMAQEIFDKEPASRRKIEEIKNLGYDVSGRVITNSDYNAVMRQEWIKNKKKNG